MYTLYEETGRIIRINSAIDSDDRSASRDRDDVLALVKISMIASRARARPYRRGFHVPEPTNLPEIVAHGSDYPPRISRGIITRVVSGIQAPQEGERAPSLPPRP